MNHSFAAQVFVALLSGTCLLVLAVAAFLGRSCKLSAYGYGSRKPPGISLQTLSYGFAPDLDFEFSDAYEHATRGAGNKHMQHDFNMHVCERFRRTCFTVSKELAERKRSVQKSVESTSM